MLLTKRTSPTSPSGQSGVFRRRCVSVCFDLMQQKHTKLSSRNSKKEKMEVMKGNKWGGGGVWEKENNPTRKKKNSTLFVLLWSVVSFASIAHWTPFSIDFHFISLARRRSLFSLTFSIAPLCLLLSQREIYNGGYRLLPAPPHYSLSLP